MRLKAYTDKNLEYLLETCKISRRDLAERLGVSEMAISHWARGGNPNKKAAKALADLASNTPAPEKQVPLYHGAFYKKYGNINRLRYLASFGVSDEELYEHINLPLNVITDIRTGRRLINSNMALAILDGFDKVVKMVLDKPQDVPYNYLNDPIFSN
jgi:plasmid maintenance system antidote protein VapI